MRTGTLLASVFRCRSQYTRPTSQTILVAGRNIFNGMQGDGLANSIARVLGVAVFENVYGQYLLLW